MRALRQSIARLTSWYGEPKAKVYHPDGNFDKLALISAVENVERLGFKPTAIVMTNDQYDEYVAKGSFAWSCGVLGYGERNCRTFMGCKIETDDVPRWCVGVEDEW